jgi:hypothetical protein
MKDQVTSECSSISFPVGYHDLHPDISINFQLNRFYGWVGDESMLTEMREAAASVRECPTFTKTFLDLADKALTRRETLKGAYYLRVAEFFLLTGDPRKLPTRQRFVDSCSFHNSGRRAHPHSLRLRLAVRLSSHPCAAQGHVRRIRWFRQLH